MPTNKLTLTETAVRLRCQEGGRTHVQLEVNGTDIGVFPIDVERIDLGDSKDEGLCVVFQSDGDHTTSGDPYLPGCAFLRVGREEFTGGEAHDDGGGAVTVRTTSRSITFWPVVA